MEYIDETGRTFNTRNEERDTRGTQNTTKLVQNIANYEWTNNHNIDFNNEKIIDKSNYQHRRTNESLLHASKTRTIIQNIYRNNTAFYSESIFTNKKSR